MEHRCGKVVIHVADGQSAAAHDGRARFPCESGTRIPRPTPHCHGYEQVRLDR